MTIPHAFALTVSAMTFASYGRALSAGFARPDGLPEKMRRLRLAVFVLATFELAWLYRNPGGSAWLLAGIAIQAVAWSLFRWAMISAAAARLPIAFSRTQTSVVLASGPWQFVRHPIYVSYALSWFAVAVSCRSVFLGAIAAAMGALYASMAINEERRLLESGLRDEYGAYLLTTGRFWPKSFHAPKGL